MFSLKKSLPVSDEGTAIAVAIQHRRHRRAGGGQAAAGPSPKAPPAAASIVAASPVAASLPKPLPVAAALPRAPICQVVVARFWQLSGFVGMGLGFKV